MFRLLAVIITAALVICKILGLTDVTWFQCAIPIIAYIVYLICLIIILAIISVLSER